MTEVEKMREACASLVEQMAQENDEGVHTSDVASEIRSLPLPTPSPVDEAREAFIDSERRVRLVEASRPLTVSEKALKFRELCAERRSRNLAWDALLAAEAKKGGSQC